MNTNRTIACLLGTALLFGAGGAWAQDNDIDDAETTIRLMGEAEAELPDAVTRDIVLPDAAGEDSEAVENARRGLETANENRARREHGLATASEARDRAADMAEEARENVEDRGRAEDLPVDVPGRPDLPDTPPDLPDVPKPPIG